VTGFTMLALKTWWLPLQPNGASLATVYTFEGVSLLANAAATLLGLALGTMIGPRDDAEARRATAFFAQLDRPIAPGEVPPATTNSAMPVLGLSTIGVGLLLAVAGLLAGSTAALLSDLTIGGALIAMGLFLRHRGRRAATGAAASEAIASHS
jgi:hypothetical protein